MSQQAVNFEGKKQTKCHAEISSIFFSLPASNTGLMSMQPPIMNCLSISYMLLSSGKSNNSGLRTTAAGSLGTGSL